MSPQDSREAPDGVSGESGQEPSSPPPLAIRMPVDVRSAMLTVVGTVLAFLALWAAGDLIIPIVVAILVAYTLDPFVRAVQRLGIGRAPAAAVLMVSLAVGAAASGYQLSDDVAAAVERIPDATEKIRREIRSWRRSGDSSVEKISQAATDLEEAATEVAGEEPQRQPGVTRVEVVEPPLQLRELLWGQSVYLLSLSGQTITLAFFLFFLLASGDLFKRKIVRLAGPALASRRITVQIIDDINRSIESFLGVMLITNVVVGFCTWLAFRWFGMEGAVLWAIAAAVFNTIPYVGSAIILLASVVVALLQFGSMETALLVGAVFLVITGFEGMLLKPWLMSRRARMNAPAVFLSLLFWGWLWGMWGLLLAFPILMVIKTIADHVESLQPVAELIGD